VETYTLDAAGLRFVRHRYLIRAVVGSLVAAAVYVLIARPWGAGREPVLRVAVTAVFQATAFALFFGSLAWSGLEHYRLTVADEKMTLSLPNLLFRPHTVCRGQIRTIIERKRSMTISRWGTIGTRLLGGVWVPRELPEYEQIRRLALTWRHGV
jgi:hypothetical protein